MPPDQRTVDVRRTIGVWLVEGLTITEMCAAIGVPPPPSGTPPVEYVINKALLAWLRLPITRRVA